WTHARVGWAGDSAIAAAPTTTPPTVATTVRVSGEVPGSRSSARAASWAGLPGSGSTWASARSSPSFHERMVTDDDAGVLGDMATPARAGTKRADGTAAGRRDRTAAIDWVRSYRRRTRGGGDPDDRVR